MRSIEYAPKPTFPRWPVPEPLTTRSWLVPTVPRLIAKLLRGDLDVKELLQNVDVRQGVLRRAQHLGLGSQVTSCGLFGFVRRPVSSARRGC